MPRVLSITAVLAAAVAMSACTSTNPPSATPQPQPTTTTAAATPTSTPTPDAAQLAKRAGAAYETAFAEFERLSLEGGADQPSPKMLEVESDLYLQQDMALLKDQRAKRFKVEGKPNTARWRSTPDQAKNGSDPRLTLQICEDRRGSTVVYPDKRREQGHLSQGYAYAKLVDGQVKLVDVDTKEVERCDW